MTKKRKSQIARDASTTKPIDGRAKRTRRSLSDTRRCGKCPRCWTVDRMRAAGERGRRSSWQVGAGN